MKDFFWGDHMVFRRNEQSVKGVCGKLTSNQTANERRSQKYYRALWDLQPKTCDPPSPSQAKSNNRFLTFSPYFSYLKISRNPDFINFFSGHRKLKEKKINEEDRQNSCHTTKDLMSAFHIFDAQNKGYIESRELREALGLTGAGIPDDELKKMLQETGLLTDRKITFAGKFLCRRFM